MNDDLRAFWERTKAIPRPLNPVLHDAPELSGRDYRSQSVVLTSFEGVRLRGSYSVPVDRPRSGRLPAVLAVPGYAGFAGPVTGPGPSGMWSVPSYIVQSGFALLSLWPRAIGDSKKEWDLPYGTKLTYSLTNRDNYYYRAGYMDCLCGVDFLASRREVDPDRIGMWGRSGGGGLTLATASLDNRLAAAVAEQPFLCNFPVAADVTTFPYDELHQYLREHPEERAKALETLATFDNLNLVHEITCPTLVDIGMRDEICPYRTIAPVFERIRAFKSLLVYPDLDHNTCTDFNVHAIAWLSRYLTG